MPSLFAETPNQSKNQLIVWFSLFSGASLLLLGLVLLVIIINSLQGIFPNQTTISNVDVSLLTKEEALINLTNSLQNKANFEIKLISPNYELATNSAQIEFTYQTSDSINQAFDLSHQNLTIKKPINLFKTLLYQKNYPLITTFNREKLQQLVDQFATEIDTPGHMPYAQLGKDGDIKTLKVDSGKVGLELNRAQTTETLQNLLNEKNDNTNVELNLQPIAVHLELTPEQTIAAEKISEKFIKTSLKIYSPNYKDVFFELTPSDLVSFLAFPTGINDQILDKSLEEIAQKVNRPSKDAKFDYEKLENGKYSVKEFEPHQDGLELDKNDLKNKIKDLINQISSTEKENIPEQTTLEMTLKTVSPTLSLEKLNDLGIKELIGFGDSYYAHSIPNRVWNVALTSEKINFSLIAPGEEFSFNKNLGEVSRRTGYRSAYVISGGKTVLGDGGGVCQVSTTLFRAALNAGLDITKRKAHSYRVSYYELNQKPGIDATVYAGDVDLRFINDTPGYILMRTETDSENLYMKIELYGTSDGRTAEILNHKTWDLRGAPAPAYYPTTEIPKGTVKQIDWAVSGIKASFDYVVKDKHGNIIHEENYYSNYVPWSAKYLQGI